MRSQRSDDRRRLRQLRQQLDLVAVMITVIIAGAVGYVGIQVMQSTHDTAGLTYNATAPSVNDGFQNSSHSLTNGINNFFSNLGTVFVVIVLVVIIGYLMLLRGR